MNFSSLAVFEWDAETLEISRISRLDMGAYLCIAQNSVPPSVSKRIKVSVDCEYMIHLALKRLKLLKGEKFSSEMLKREIKPKADITVEIRYNFKFQSKYISIA